jgi:hypothetical protein
MGVGLGPQYSASSSALSKSRFENSAAMTQELKERQEFQGVAGNGDDEDDAL